MRHLGLVPMVLCASIACACSASSDPEPYSGGGAGGSSGSGGTSSDASPGGSGGSGGGFDATIPIDPDSGDLDGWVQPDGDTCSAQTVAAEPYPLDMYVMLDQSGSMDGDIGISGKSKWTALVDAFTAFLNNTTQQGLSMGMQFFPLPIKPWDQMTDCDPNAPNCGDGLCVTVDIGPLCHDSCAGGCAPESECRGSDPGFCSNDRCDVAAYATPEVPIAEIPGVNASLLAALNGHGPLTMTPTGPALQGAIQHAKEWAIAHPQRKTIVILATDGMPTVCPASDSEAERVNAVKQTAQAGVAGTPSIKTFVIGVEMAMNFVNINNLHGMAAAGGTNQAFIVNPNQDMSAQFAAALEAIRGAAMQCEFKIPTTGAMLDYDQVNVVYTAVNNTEHTVYYVGDISQCDPINGGWFYDTDPKQTKPTKILLCPQSCDFMQQHGGKIDIEIGCKTMTPPK